MFSRHEVVLREQQETTVNLAVRLRPARFSRSASSSMEFSSVLVVRVHPARFCVSASVPGWHAYISCSRVTDSSCEILSLLPFFLSQYGVVRRDTVSVSPSVLTVRIRPARWQLKVEQRIRQRFQQRTRRLFNRGFKREFNREPKRERHTQESIRGFCREFKGTSARSCRVC